MRGSGLVAEFMTLFEDRLDRADKENRLGKFRFDLLTASRQILLFSCPNPDGLAIRRGDAPENELLSQRLHTAPQLREDWQGNGRGVLIDLNFNCFFAENKKDHPELSCGNYPESEEESRALALQLRKSMPRLFLRIEEGDPPHIFPPLARDLGEFCGRFLRGQVAFPSGLCSPEGWLVAEGSVPAGVLHISSGLPARISFEEFFPLLQALTGY